MPAARLGTDVTQTVFQNGGETTYTNNGHTLVAPTIAGTRRKLFIKVAMHGADASIGTPSGVTYGGVAATLANNGTAAVASQVVTTFEAHSSVWYIDEDDLPADGARDAVVSGLPVAAVRIIWVEVSEWEGIAAGQPAVGAIDIDISASGTTITSTLSPPAGGVLIAAMVANITGTDGWSSTAGSESFSSPTNQEYAGTYKIEPGGTTTFTRTIAGTSYNRCACVGVFWAAQPTARLPLLGVGF